MRVQVKLFGSVREATGAKELSVELPGDATLADLHALLARDYPAIEALDQRLMLSVNLEAAPLETRLRDGDEVALLPPVSGGSGRCTISSVALDVQAVIARVVGPDTGGIATFIGTVRDRARGHEIEHLEYEAYPEMAEREMEKIAAQAQARFGARVAIAHRTGHLSIGDIAVVVVAATPHRGEAFDACRFAIDTLKQTVPIWKKEIATDGAYWVDDHA